MENLVCLDAHFYFDVDGDLARLSLNGLSDWNKEVDNKCAEDMKKHLADLYNVDVSEIRRISQKEYLDSEEDNDLEIDEDEDEF